MTFEKDTTKRRDIIKKVIAYMTLGIDVSALFSEMCKVGFEMLGEHILEHYLGLKSWRHRAEEDDLSVFDQLRREEFIFGGHGNQCIPNGL